MLIVVIEKVKTGENGLAFFLYTSPTAAERVQSLHEFHCLRPVDSC